MGKVKVNLSVAAAVKNEENNIVDFLQSSRGVADEIVLADAASNDRTVDLAKRLGAEVISTKDRKMFHINKNLAIDNCHGKWILLLDADERISEELSQELKKIIKTNPQENGFWVNRRNWFLGGFLTKGGAYPDPVIRLFRNGKGRLPEVSVHEQVKIDGDVGHLKGDIIHFSDPDFSRYLQRANRYTDLTADKYSKEKVGKSVFHVIFYSFFKPLITFIDIYFRHGGFKDGFRGFIWALFSGAHHFLAYSKYITQKNNL